METVDILNELLRQAMAGKVVGLAVLSMEGGYGYSVYTAGLAKYAPTLTRGMLRALDDKLGEIVGSK